MKKLLIAAGLLAIGATTASAQAPMWRKDLYPYPERHHRMCQDKAHRLWDYERRASADGRLSWSERRTIAALRRDLDSTCGRYRWRG